MKILNKTQRKCFGFHFTTIPIKTLSYARRFARRADKSMMFDFGGDVCQCHNIIRSTGVTERDINYAYTHINCDMHRYPTKTQSPKTSRRQCAEIPTSTISAPKNARAEPPRRRRGEFCQSGRLPLLYIPTPWGAGCP